MVINIYTINLWDCPNSFNSSLLVILLTICDSPERNCFIYVTNLPSWQRRRNRKDRQARCCLGGCSDLTGQKTTSLNNNKLHFISFHLLGKAGEGSMLSTTGPHDNWGLNYAATSFQTDSDVNWKIPNIKKRKCICRQHNFNSSDIYWLKKLRVMQFVWYNFAWTVFSL